VSTDEAPYSALAEPDPCASDKTIARLAAHYPKGIFVAPELRRPLKRGVFNDLWASLAGTITPDELRDALKDYVGHRSYLEKCVAGTPRIDLWGANYGVVSKDDERFAELTLNGEHPLPLDYAIPPVKNGG
jgi:sRNA-binding protein